MVNNYQWFIDRMSDPNVDAKLTLSSAGGANALSNIKFDMKPNLAPQAPGTFAPTGLPATTPMAAPTIAPTPQFAPQTFTGQPPVDPSTAALNSQGGMGTIASLLAGMGAGFFGKDSPAQNIGATIGGVGRNLAYNAALKKQLAAMMGDGGNSNF